MTESSMPNIPRALVRLRVLLAISQVKFAESIGFDNCTISFVERGRHEASSRLIAAIQERYGIDLYVYAWALGRRERFGVEIVQSMEAAVCGRKAA